MDCLIAIYAVLAIATSGAVLGAVSHMNREANWCSIIFAGLIWPVIWIAAGTGVALEFMDRNAR